MPWEEMEQGKGNWESRGRVVVVNRVVEVGSLGRWPLSKGL